MGCSKKQSRNSLTEKHFPKQGPLDFKEKTKKLESGLKMKASWVMSHTRIRLTAGTARPGMAAGDCD